MVSDTQNNNGAVGKEILEKLDVMINAATETSAAAGRIEEATRKAVIVENNVFKRRNRVLVVLLAGVLLIQIVTGVREVFVEAPRRENTRDLLTDLQEANEGITHLVEFVAEAQSAGPSPETVQVFRDAAEIREIVCTIQDPAVQEACQRLNATE